VKTNFKLPSDFISVTFLNTLGFWYLLIQVAPFELPRKTLAVSTKSSNLDIIPPSFPPDTSPSS
jgi:hypothetical protein